MNPKEQVHKYRQMIRTMVFVTTIGSALFANAAQESLSMCHASVVAYVCTRDHNGLGLDVGYFITPSLQASVGYYYQHRDQEEVDGSGILGRLAYAINNDLTVAANLSYDEAFDTRFSADLTWRFNTNGGPGNDTPKANNAVKALTSTPSNRDVRVHDCTVYINNAVHDCTALPRGALVIPFPGGVG